MSSRKDFQWQRKLFHLLNGTLGFSLYVYSGLPKTLVLFILGFCVFVCFTLDLLRFRFSSFNQWLSQKTSGVIRQEEAKKFTSMTKGLGLAFLVLILFPQKVGILIILYMTYADAAAGIVGSLWGKHYFNRHASFEGTLAFFGVALASSLFAFFFVFQPVFVFSLKTLLLALSISFIATATESLFPKFDDNVMIPLLGAPAIYLVFALFSL